MEVALVSVVVPSYRRPEILGRCLDHLAAQQNSPPFEVVVVIDGDDDYAAARLPDRARAFPAPLRWAQRAHRGQGAALNEAIRMASGELVLILGDDLFAAPDCVARHAERHRVVDDARVAVQGRVEWHADVLPDRFLEWEREAGVMFAFSRMAPHAFVPPRFCYTTNTSLRKDLVQRAGGFDETLPLWYDTAFAFAAAKHGLRVYYDPDCVAWHHDRWCASREAARRYRKGEIAAEILARDPSFAEFAEVLHLDLSRRIRHRVSCLVRPFAERWGPRALRGWCWIHEIHYAFARGFDEACARIHAGSGARGETPPPPDR